MSTEPASQHEGHRILEAPQIAVRWIRRWCNQCDVEIEPRDGYTDD